MTPVKLISTSSSLIHAIQLTASRAAASVASLLRLLVSTLAEIISSSVDDNSALSCVSSYSEPIQ